MSEDNHIDEPMLVETAMEKLELLTVTVDGQQVVVDEDTTVADLKRVLDIGPEHVLAYRADDHRECRLFQLPAEDPVLDHIEPSQRIRSYPCPGRVY